MEIELFFSSVQEGYLPSTKYLFVCIDKNYFVLLSVIYNLEL